MHRSLSLAACGLMLLIPAAAIAAPEDQAQPAVAAAKVDPSARIEALLSHIAGMTDAKFIRNGKDYDAADAAKFLRAKWDKQRGEIQSAEDFITKVATKSSTSGKPYLIRFKDGHETECGPYLSAELKKLEAKDAPPKEKEKEK